MKQMNEQIIYINTQDIYETIKQPFDKSNIKIANSNMFIDGSTPNEVI